MWQALKHNFYPRPHLVIKCMLNFSSRITIDVRTRVLALTCIDILLVLSMSSWGWKWMQRFFSFFLIFFLNWMDAQVVVDMLAPGAVLMPYFWAIWVQAFKGKTGEYFWDGKWPFFSQHCGIFAFPVQVKIYNLWPLSSSAICQYLNLICAVVPIMQTSNCMTGVQFQKFSHSLFRFHTNTICCVTYNCWR